MDRKSSTMTEVAVDVGVVLTAIVSIALVTSQIEVSDGERALDALGYAAIGLAGTALAFRRRNALVSVSAITVTLAVYVGRGYVGGPIFLTELLALYFLAVATNRRRALVAAGVATAALVAVGALAGQGGGLIHLLFFAWAATAVLLGDAVRSRREHLATLEERARYLERTQEEEARRRVVEERLRIARDLHDSMAHSMATINVQAGAAEHVLERHPDQARQALAAIRNASGDVLDELAAMLGLLRVDSGEAQPRSPIPTLEQLSGLVESTRRAGIDVQLHGDPAQSGATRTVSGAAYRIVQESLTNVLRHAGATSVSLRIDGSTDGEGNLVVEITDDGRGGNGDTRGAGMGIVGMRERAEATGGRLEAGTRPEGGFAVRATWPGRG